MQVTCGGNNVTKKHVWLSIETCLGLYGIFFVFFAINQNIDTYLCIHVKNHRYHKNNLKLNYSKFSFKFVSNKCYLQKVAQSIGVCFSFFF